MKNIIKLLMALTLAVALVGCGSEDTTEKDTFIMGIDSDPSNVINVVTTNDRSGLMTVNTVFSPLYKYMAGGEVEYKLADSIEASEDGLTYTVKLKEDVKWHDGEDFNADDVVFTFTTLLENEQSEQSGPLQFGGEKVEVTKVDDYTVEFQLKSAKPNAMEVFGAAFIMPEHIYKDVTDYATSTITPVGTGPYEYVEYNEGESTVLVANQEYFDGAPSIENLIFKVISNSDTAIEAMKNSEIDGLAIIPEDVEKFDDSFSINPYSEGRLGYMSFNFNTPSENSGLIKDQNFRKAVMYAINQEEVIEAAYISEEYSLNPASFLPSTALYTTDDVENYDVDVDKAKELLAETEGENATLTLAFPSNPANEATALIIQSNLKEIGITLNLDAMDPSAFYKSTTDKSGEYDLYLNGYIMTIDPDGFAPLFTTDNAMNSSGYSNKTIDELFAAGIEETDSEKREEIYVELQKEFMENAFFLPLTENKRIVVVGENVNLDDAKFAPIYTFDDWSKVSFK